MNKNFLKDAFWIVKAQELANSKVALLQSVEAEIRSEVSVLLEYYQNHIWVKWIDAYRDYFLDNSERGATIQKWQSNMKTPIVKMHVDAMWASVYDNLIDFRVIGRTKDDQAKAELVHNYLQWCFGISKSRPHLMQVLKEAFIVGVGFAAIGFKKVTKEIVDPRSQVRVEGIDEEFPFMRYASIFNIFFDPSVESIYHAPRVYERHILTREQIIDQYSTILVNIEDLLDALLLKQNGLKKDDKNEIHGPFSNYDYNKIKHSIFWEMDDLNRNTFKECNPTGKSKCKSSRKIMELLTVDFKAGVFFEVVERWTAKTFTLLINGRAVYTGDNPLPLKAIPYGDIQYGEAPGMAFGHGIATSLAGIQTTVDHLVNLGIDNARMTIAPMYWKTKGTQIGGVKQDKIRYEPLKVLTTNDDNWFKKLELGSPDFSSINFAQFLMNFAEMSEGVSSYSLWYQNKIERSATAVSQRVTSMKNRLLPTIEAMNRLLAFTAEHWMALSLLMTSDKIYYRVMEKKVQWGKDILKEIDLTNISGKYDFEFDAQALKSASRDVKREQLLQLLQLAQSGVDQNNGQQFLDMTAVWSEVLDTFELPQSLIRTVKEIAAKKKETDVAMAKADIKAQQEIQKVMPQGQPGQMPGMEEQPGMSTGQVPDLTQGEDPRAYSREIDQSIQFDDADQAKHDGFFNSLQV